MVTQSYYYYVNYKFYYYGIEKTLGVAKLVRFVFVLPTISTEQEFMIITTSTIVWEVFCSTKYYSIAVLWKFSKWWLSAHTELDTI